MKPKVTQVSDTFFEVLNHSVKIQTRRGRVLLLCSCTNSTMFCKESPLCYHKQLVIEHLNTKDLKKSAKQMENELKANKKLKLQTTPEMYEDYLARLFQLIKKL